MWDVFMYMCCFYWLMNKAVLPNDLAEHSQAGNLNRDIEREQAESGDAMQLLKEADAMYLPPKQDVSKYEPCDKI